MATIDLTVLRGRTRSSTVPGYTDLAEEEPGITPRGAWMTSQDFPVDTEIVRLGNTWSMQIPTASAFTHVADMPTTRAELALYNNDGAGGKTYVVDSIWYFSLTSITAASGATLIYQVAAAAAALTNNTAILVNSPVGKTYTGNAQRALAVTTMTANKWAALACQGAGAAASIGHGVFAKVNGGIQVRPGATLGLNVILGTATGTGLIGIAWHEIQMTGQ